MKGFLFFSNSYVDMSALLIRESKTRACSSSLYACLVQPPDQLWRQRRGELVGHPGGEVALGVAVRDVAQGAAVAVARQRADHET